MQAYKCPFILTYFSYIRYYRNDGAPAAPAFTLAADTLFELFGVDRLLWGSNWPPELLGGTYAEAFDLMLGCAGDLSFTEYSKVFRENAERVYGMNG